MSEEAKNETPFYDPDPITMPVLAFYLLLQRAFIASIASTGVKG